MMEVPDTMPALLTNMWTGPTWTQANARLNIRLSCNIAGLHCTALHCTALHCTALHCTALHCTALYCTALHSSALHCTALHCTCSLVFLAASYISSLNKGLQWSKWWVRKGSPVGHIHSECQCLVSFFLDHFHSLPVTNLGGDTDYLWSITLTLKGKLAAYYIWVKRTRMEIMQKSVIFFSTLQFEYTNLKTVQIKSKNT